MKLFLDTEFNEFGGELISMALVSDWGAEWYQVRKMTTLPGEWVSQHVIPKLDKLPLEHHEFRASFASFISVFDGCEVIADWPADLEHFCALLSGVGAEAGFSVPLECTLRLIRGGETEPDNPHNALSDARALRDWYMAQDFSESDAVQSAAKIIGRRGGKAGGLARAKALSPERRSEIAKAAAHARWNGNTAR